MANARIPQKSVPQKSVPQKVAPTPTPTGVQRVSPLPQFETISTGFPKKGTDDPDVIALGDQALQDGLVRKGPDGDETTALLATLRKYASDKNAKLKTRTSGKTKYWQILPKDNSQK